MKTLYAAFLLSIWVLFGGSDLSAQTLLVWDDQQDLISNDGETQLTSKLASSNIQVVMTIDYKKRCDYFYAELTSTLSKPSLVIYDCNRKVVGSKSWMSKFLSIPEEERITLVAFAIVEIIENPVITKAEARKGEPGQEVKFTDNNFSIPFNHHNTRHFFSPTSYNLKRGELYYSTLNFASHDVQYGATDNFSVGMGTSFMANPFYITPKLSFQINEKNSVSIGTLFFLSTWGPTFTGNLAYGTYTYGDQFNNITLGIGHLYFEGDEFDNKANTPLVNISGMTRMSDYMYFISENYVFNQKADHTAYYYGTPKTLWGWEGPVLFEERFTVANTYFAGMLGFRFVNKQYDISAWQFGLSYIVRASEGLPTKYDSNLWDSSFSPWKRVVFPTIGYVRKLGKRV
jgi:hypothetical protein